MKILIADDDAISRRMLEWLVVRCGDEPISVDNGATAVWLLEQEDAPRIAILDWMMPDLDGIRICESLRRRTDGAYIYVFLVKSRAQKCDLIRGLRAGAAVTTCP